MSLRLNKKRWLVSDFSQYSKPNWPCPKCGIGELTFLDDWAKREDDSKTKLAKSSNPNYFNYNPKGQKGYFAGFIICSRDLCKEPISLCGVITYNSAYNYKKNISENFRLYTPKFFYPNLSIIQIGLNCPLDIKQQIEKSFSHFFNDYSACANSIRTSLELLMNEQGVKKTYITKKNERKNYSLHERIELFGKSKADLKPFLLAAKWIGNAGSHIGEINKESLLDGYELLEHCLDELYEKKNRMKKLNNKAKVINRTKKPVPAPKKK